VPTEVNRWRRLVADEHAVVRHNRDHVPLRRVLRLRQHVEYRASRPTAAEDKYQRGPEQHNQALSDPAFPAARVRRTGAETRAPA
jgi:hypothetical protein